MSGSPNPAPERHAWRSRRDEMRLALAFMTRLPMGDLSRAPALSRAAWALPLAGLPVGLASGLVLAATATLPPAAAGLLAVITGVLLTGGLHEDGLADLADGCGGGATRTRKLDIMRDSHIGSFGVLALVLAVGLRATLLAGLAEAALSWPALVLTVAAVAVASRAPLAVLMAGLPRARADGLGASMARGCDIGAATRSVGFGVAALVIVAACAGIGSALATAFGIAIGAAAVGALAQRQLGGVSGDVLGAAQVVAELSALALLVGVIGS